MVLPEALRDVVDADLIFTGTDLGDRHSLLRRGRLDDSVYELGVTRVTIRGDDDTIAMAEGGQVVHHRQGEANLEGNTSGECDERSRANPDRGRAERLR